MRTTWHADLFIHIFGKEFKPWICSLRNSLQLRGTSSQSTLFSDTLICVPSVMCEAQFHVHKKVYWTTLTETWNMCERFGKAATSKLKVTGSFDKLVRIYPTRGVTHQNTVILIFTALRSSNIKGKTIYLSGFWNRRPLRWRHQSMTVKFTRLGVQFHYESQK